MAHWSYTEMHAPSAMPGVSAVCFRGQPPRGTAATRLRANRCRLVGTLGRAAVGTRWLRADRISVSPVRSSRRSEKALVRMRSGASNIRVERAGRQRNAAWKRATQA